VKLLLIKEELAKQNEVVVRSKSFAAIRICDGCLVPGSFSNFVILVLGPVTQGEGSNVIVRTVLIGCRYNIDVSDEYRIERMSWHMLGCRAPHNSRLIT